MGWLYRCLSDVGSRALAIEYVRGQKPNDIQRA